MLYSLAEGHEDCANKGVQQNKLKIIAKMKIQTYITA